ncbi:hypothetical protein ACIQM4_13795 [Streptomyces sp. NPDC091272]|uniref:hypothetical protein n=1 Tax=Streptomyces sp. NPDC091272 TaxID=3365981 RepID=UPI00381D9912
MTPAGPAAPKKPMTDGPGEPLGGPDGRLAETGGRDDRLPLVGGIALGLASLGVLARTVARRRRG